MVSTIAFMCALLHTYILKLPPNKYETFFSYM